MTAHQQIAYLELDNQAFALMSRLHVILRRECGRITDIEYMRVNPEYCRHVIDVAAKMQNDNLRQLSERLDLLFFGANGLFVRSPPKPPLLEQLSGSQDAQAKQQAGTTPLPGPHAGMEPLPEHPGQADAIGNAYIGRLR